MKCFFCKGRIANGFTTNTTDLGTCVIVIRQVPCHKCTQCGESSFTLDVAERLEQVVDSLRESVTEVAVLQFTHAA